MKRERQPFELKNLKYSYLKDNLYSINLTFKNGVVNTINFEKLLKECYYRSKLKIVQKVLFDLSGVKFIDLLEFGLLSVWILDLKNRGKEITVKFPVSTSPAYSFLERYGFEKFLEENSIENVKEKNQRGDHI